jgi:hypothetical protein
VLPAFEHLRVVITPFFDLLGVDGLRPLFDFVVVAIFFCFK